MTADTRSSITTPTLRPPFAEPAPVGEAAPDPTLDPAVRVIVDVSLVPLMVTVTVVLPVVPGKPVGFELPVAVVMAGTLPSCTANPLAVSVSVSVEASPWMSAATVHTAMPPLIPQSAERLKGRAVSISTKWASVEPSTSVAKTRRELCQCIASSVWWILLTRD